MYHFLPQITTARKPKPAGAPIRPAPTGFDRSESPNHDPVQHPRSEDASLALPLPRRGRRDRGALPPQPARCWDPSPRTPENRTPPLRAGARGVRRPGVVLLPAAGGVDGRLRGRGPGCGAGAGKRETELVKRLFDPCPPVAGGGFRRRPGPGSGGAGGCRGSCPGSSDPRGPAGVRVSRCGSGSPAHRRPGPGSPGLRGGAPPACGRRPRSRRRPGCRRRRLRRG